MAASIANHSVPKKAKRAVMLAVDGMTRCRALALMIAGGVLRRI